MVIIVIAFFCKYGWGKNQNNDYFRHHKIFNQNNKYRIKYEIYIFLNLYLNNSKKLFERNFKKCNIAAKVSEGEGQKENTSKLKGKLVISIPPMHHPKSLRGKIVFKTLACKPLPPLKPVLSLSLLFLPINANPSLSLIPFQIIDINPYYL